MGLYFVSLGLILYNFLLFLSTKQTNYHYVLFLFFFTFFLSILEGYGFKFIFRDYPWFNNNGLYLVISLSSIFLLSFSKNYLSISYEYFPKISKAYDFFTIGFILGAILSFFLPYSMALRYSVLLDFFGLGVLLSSGLISLRKGYKPLQYFLISFFFFILGTSLRSFSLYTFCKPFV